MTYNEIIQTMRYFASQKVVVNQHTGQVLIMQDILDIIDRQKEEIERLEKEKVKHHLIATAVIDEDVLKKFMDEGLKESPRKISMMSFTKEEISTYVPVHAIDSLVKEMTEGKYAGKDI